MDMTVSEAKENLFPRKGLEGHELDVAENLRR